MRAEATNVFPPDDTDVANIFSTLRSISPYKMVSLLQINYSLYYLQMSFLFLYFTLFLMVLVSMLQLVGLSFRVLYIAHSHSKLTCIRIDLAHSGPYYRSGC